MVSRPGYIERLKVYAKERVTGSDKTAEAIDNFSSESDRGAIILASSTLEDALEIEIKQKLPGLKGDDSIAKRLFEHDGPIATFSRKTEMAYALGIIDKEYKRKIDLIREIRNACAHSRLPLSLDKPVLLDAVKAVMKDDAWAALKNHEPITVRLAFVVQCAFISHYVLTGRKIESFEEQLEHYRQIMVAEAKA